MKLNIFSKLTLFCSCVLLSFSAWSADISSAQNLLVKMTEAKDKLNYEMSFISGSAVDIHALQYRHVIEDKKHYAQLTSLDGRPKEIIQRDNLVSYFIANTQPVTIQGNAIVDDLPALMGNNFEQLAQHYDFVLIGKNRVAGRIAQGIRILPKDDFRYQYVVFVDEESGLLLQSHLLDRDGNLLEQFRVINLYVGDSFTGLVEYLNKEPFPPLIEQVKSQPELNWKPEWLPAGFKKINQSIGSLTEEENEKVENQLYSDGLFSFSLYVSNASDPESLNNLWLNGVNTVYSEVIQGKEVTFVGRLPLSTAKRIIRDIRFQ
ncbi:sigma-E factor regulatory protein RseB [[Haemophilus] felis]|uniref:Sigma-E factor regulatory protein RseB n=1 Tax=[Haemophilus] felis TaxID=123822 RepID=A0A1T0B0W5_9PAST|nr:sigma-E factor regulatory protein RseB [[Haemophilus] felis]NBI41149.1 sigma-E factor regulatory protein RseB [[Haemophilus] felis]OOS03843.1 sigma-E factor regulatory protein RseB [[Haemophilus] felis]